jgi:hypothetical protein
MAAAAALLAGLTAGVFRRGLAVSYAGCGLLLAVLLCLLQTLPLPPGLRALIAPGSDADLRQLLQGLPTWPHPQTAWLPLSVDPSSTGGEAVSLAAALCLLVALGAVGQSAPPVAPPDAQKSLGFAGWLVAAPTLVCLLGALAALGLPLPSPIAVPGPGATRALLAAGLYNSNHMATLAGLGALMSLGLALSLPTTGRPGLRALLLLSSGLCNVALLGTLSRAGIATWLVAQAALWAWALYSARRASRKSRSAILRLGLFGLLCSVLFGALLADRAPTLLHQRLVGFPLANLADPGSKIHVWREALPVLRGHLLFGVGHGAGENLLQHVHALAGRMRFVYLENQWLQLIFDFGLLGAGLLLACLGLALRDVLRTSEPRLPPTLRQAVLLALLALSLHNLFDFNLAVAGVAWPALGLVALVEHRCFLVPARLVFALAVLTLLGVFVVAAFSPSHDQDGATLKQLASDGGTPTSAVVAHGEEASARHPFDSYLPALVGARLLQDDQPAQARIWLNRALLRNPRDSLALRETARLHWLTGHSIDAPLFLRLALTHGDDEDQRRSLDLLAQRAASAEEARLALPSPALLVALLDVAGNATAPRWSLIDDLARSALPPAAEPAATVERAAYWLGRSALAQRRAPAARDALAQLLALPAGPGSQLPALLVADLIDLQTDSGQPQDAARLGQAALSRTRPVEWLLATARASLRLTPAPLAAIRPLLDEALASSQALPSTSRPLLARAHELYAELETAAGNPTAALVHTQTAASLRQP